MERRFKIVAICMSDLATYGKHLDHIFNKALGPNVSILRQKEDIFAASTFYLVHSPDFPLLEPKEIVPSMEIELPDKDKFSVQPKDSKIVLPN